MRLEAKSCGADIWPPYNDVRDAKAQYRPPKEVVMISETVAEVSLQSLLNHTVQRIVNLQEEVIHQSMSSTDLTEVDVVLTCSWGFDGSTGHSAYKQRYQNEQAEAVNDESLFVTTLIPLRFSSSTGIIFWNNRTTQSARFCRPLKLEYVKECSDVIMRQKQLIEDQINQLKIFEINLNDYRIRVLFSLLLTLIDGKVLNIITGTKSMQTCPICHATPNKFNDLSNRLKGLFLPNPNSLQYGISPLHAWIRLLECCLHIAYRINIKKWQMRSKSDKAEFARRKQEVQVILWEKLDLRVDKPKVGGSGTTNDGNTARRAFEHPDSFADYLGLNRQLVRNFKTILIALPANSRLILFVLTHCAHLQLRFMSLATLGTRCLRRCIKS
ncbi:unnamed protein product [Lasius platythorax]|uniref:Uncharacterized protein n=1 Tax=Lasius platythorax TaxID=488582 RepID=A0AAV2MXB1_9HYME